MPGTTFRSLLLVAIAGGSAFAAPALTTIQDTLYKADGSRFTGIVQIEWKSFRAPDGTEVAQNTMSVRVSLGQLSVALMPTTNAVTPTTYTVRYNADGRNQFVEYWSVPPSDAPLRLSQVRSAPPLAGAITNPSVAVAIQDVSGLRTELDLRPARGASWVPGRAAVIGASGAIDAAIGSPGDCVRVDGSSGPCGAGGLRFVDGESPLGSINGSNRAFSLSAAPSPAGSLVLYRNGLVLKQGIGYTLSGSIVTFVASQTPQPGDILSVWYRIDTESTAPVNVVDLETPGGVVNGTNREFTLSAAPLPAASLQLFRNGLLQKAGVDFTLSVDKITFLPGSTPWPGDVLQASFRK